MKKIIIFIAFFFFSSFLTPATGQKVKSFDDWAVGSAQKFSSFNPEFQCPALDLGYRESFQTPSVREYGATLSLRWKAGNISFGGYVGGSVVEVDDVVEDPNLNHSGRRTREGIFLGYENNPKKFLYFSTTVRAGHLWQVRPGDGIPGGFHALESNLQLSAGIRFPTGNGSFLIPHLLVGGRHLSQKKQPHEGIQPFVGLGISVTGYP